MLNSILFYLVSFQKIKDEHLISSYNLINIINSIEKFIPGFMLSQKTIVDFRSILNEQDLEKIGFKYYYIGKKI